MPFDFYRYTEAAARNLAERSGLQVELAAADGGYSGCALERSRPRRQVLVGRRAK